MQQQPQQQKALSIPQAIALGMEHHCAGRLVEAETIYRHVLQVDPSNASAMHLLGLIAHACGKPQAAADHVSKAIALRPGVADFHSDLGVILANLGRYDEAAVECQRAIKLDPDHVGARNNLGSICRAQGRLDEAVGWFETALKRNPNHVDTLNNFGLTLKDQGQIDRALELVRRAIALSPTSARMHSNVLLMLHYRPNYDPQAVFEEHVQWGRIHGDPLAARIGPHANDRDPNRRLRVGYVSPDFCAHPVSYFVEPLLAARDAVAVQTFCYADVPVGDDVTKRLHGLADEWRTIAGLSDEQVAQLIRQDQIDILVDLSGHTGDHRLLVFARKPAPIQVTYLGYCDTSGLRTIDYLLTDSIVDPEDDPARFTEKLIRIGGGFSCFAPPPNAPPAASLLDASAPVTFGAMPVLAKLNSEVIDTWAQILRAAANARLLLYRHSLGGETRERLVREFTSRGIARDRLDFRDKLQAMDPALAGRWHLQLYREIDIGLDTFPWSGHTSACEALWMGVPVITLRGSSHVGRMVASLLTQLGRKEWIASSRNEYVSKAAEMATRVNELRSKRQVLRDLMRKSRLCDASAFCREIEQAYRQMWTTWVSSCPAPA